MKPEGYAQSFIGYKAIIEQLQKTATQAAEESKKEESKDTLLNMTRRHLIECFLCIARGAIVINTALDDMTVDIATITQLKGSPTTRRFFVDDTGTLREGTLAECAEHEGLSITEYLAKEAEELAKAQDFFVEET